MLSGSLSSSKGKDSNHSHWITWQRRLPRCHKKIKKILLLEKNLNSSVHLYMDTSVKCNQQNLRPTIYVHLHYFFFLAKRLFDGINVDPIGEYKLAKYGNKFALTSINHISGFLITCPCQQNSWPFCHSSPKISGFHIWAIQTSHIWQQLWVLGKTKAF